MNKQNKWAECPACQDNVLSTYHAAMNSVLGVLTTCPKCNSKIRHSRVVTSIMTVLSIIASILFVTFLFDKDTQTLEGYKLLYLIPFLIIIFLVNVLVVKHTRVNITNEKSVKGGSFLIFSFFTIAMILIYIFIRP